MTHMDKDKTKLLWALFRSTFWVGLTTFGGGLAVVAQMSREFVDKRGWLTEKDMADYVTVSQSLPGVIAVNVSVILGYRLGGVRGGVVAALGSALPSLLVLCVVTVMYEAFIENRFVLGALRGVRGAVAALLFSVVWRLRRASVTGAFGYVLCGAAFCLVFFLNINPVFVLLGGGLVGLAVTGWRIKRGL